jgi:DNA-binding MarR family transcriptional regulator
MVSDKMHGKSTAVSRSLKSLEERGYIQRTVNEKDRRITYVCLTQPGEKMLRSAEKIMDEFTDAVFGRLGEENLDKLIDYLNTLFDVASEEIELRRYDKKETEKTSEKKGMKENG